jgi:hypothetical protein
MQPLVLSIPGDFWDVQIYRRPHEYRREVVDVRLNDGRTIPAWAYILTEGNPPYPRIPAEDYLKWREYRDNT